MNYTVKDSVFSFIFRQPENTCRLYPTLHSGDKVSVRWSSILGIVESVKQGHTRKCAGYGPAFYLIYDH